MAFAALVAPKQSLPLRNVKMAKLAVADGRRGGPLFFGIHLNQFIANKQIVKYFLSLFRVNGSSGQQVSKRLQSELMNLMTSQVLKKSHFFGLAKDMFFFIPNYGAVFYFFTSERGIFFITNINKKNIGAIILP